MHHTAMVADDHTTLPGREKREERPSMLVQKTGSTMAPVANVDDLHCV